MSILIKGMETPKDGVYWCEIGVADDIAMITIHGEDRKSFPLVPVPPHGRLGDLDELEKSFREDADAEWNRFSAPVNWADAFDDVANIVADAPTVIEAEEGEW